MNQKLLSFSWANEDLTKVTTFGFCLLPRKILVKVFVLKIQSKNSLFSVRYIKEKVKFMIWFMILKLELKPFNF